MNTFRVVVANAARWLKFTPTYTVWGVGQGVLSEIMIGLSESHQEGQAPDASIEEMLGG